MSSTDNVLSYDVIIFGAAISESIILDAWWHLFSMGFFQKLDLYRPGGAAITNKTNASWFNQGWQVCFTVVNMQVPL